jgi:manganese/zinc/iron transport system substrate-binding protein
MNFCAVVIRVLSRLVFILPCTLLFIGCGKAPESSDYSEKNGRLKVLSTIAMIADIVKEIGDEYVDCALVIQGELDPHTYELVKGDDEKFAAADLIFCNGLGLEHGYSLRTLLQKEAKAVALGNWILEKDPSLILTVGDQHDPHIWMDVSLWARIVDPIVEALSQKDPAHAAVFRERGHLCVEKMHKLDSEVYEVMQSIPEEKRYLVTSHNAFHYFTRRYLATENETKNEVWKIRSQAPEGIAPDAELSVSDIESVIKYIEKTNVRVIFAESNINKDALDKIVSVAKKQGKDLRLSQEILYADAMGEEDSYLKMIAHNATVIAKELKQ